MTSTSRHGRALRRLGLPALALVAIGVVVPRPSFYAHHHAGDGAGHVHPLPAASIRDGHGDGPGVAALGHGRTAPAGHSHAGAHPHGHGTEHSHGHGSAHAHDHGGGHSYAHVESGAHDTVLVSADVPGRAGDHWHTQDPFQHAAPSLVHTAALVERIELVAALPAIAVAKVTLPAARSRGPPSLPSLS